MTAQSNTAPQVIKLPLGMENIIFEFSFSEDDPLTPPYNPFSPPSSPPSSSKTGGELTLESPSPSSRKAHFPYVQCLIYRSDHPEKYFIWSGTLGASPQIPFELTYKDKENISGNFNLYQNVSIGSYYVFFDVHYGIDLEHHYEGSMIQIPTS